jgi:hypothetical protein
MSYNIQVYTVQTMMAEIEAESEDFFDNDKNLIPFTEKQLIKLRENILKHNFEITKEDKKGVTFKNDQYDGMKAILTSNALYLRSSYDDSFEIGMIASELTDSDEFAKYDPQADGWEVLGE